jgi:hypothetical protein
MVTAMALFLRLDVDIIVVQEIAFGDYRDKLPTDYVDEGSGNAERRKLVKLPQEINWRIDCHRL